MMRGKLLHLKHMRSRNRKYVNTGLSNLLSDVRSSGLGKLQFPALRLHHDFPYAGNAEKYLVIGVCENTPSPVRKQRIVTQQPQEGLGIKQNPHR